MRKTFINTLTELARKDKDIFLLTGDLGFSVFENFAKELPDQFINCGVMEQSMISIAAGLALNGKKPYVYSIIPFATMRPFEQIRNDICYQNANVKIIGIGAGFAYGAFGSTHYAIEDIAILKSLPNITILSPADDMETKAITLQLHQKLGPAYMRLLKPEKNLLPPGTVTVISKPSIIQEGKDGVIITTGACLETGIAVAKKLQLQKINLKLISMHTLKPIDEKMLVEQLMGQKRIFTLEEHRISGGLGSIISQIITKYNLNNASLQSFGVDDNYQPITGHQEYLAAHYGLDVDSVYKKIIKSII